jgi:hypothetical protein
MAVRGRPGVRGNPGGLIATQYERERRLVRCRRPRSGSPSYAFDVSSLGFANAWLALGGFAVCSGWVVLSTRVVGRWLGW